ncbi:hypothetical protein [Alloacidobacterium sp.]|uniref:hypothetical protein n=1 Tax=Alloacidobacterium sp. TaxID=2951999 RepID=UPI002D5B81C0|nr:hypothetical protein [Alloacidobacterium sp.]HYK34934.1 hypothetical protein [Alloacidobacterium sp.]
MSVQDTVKLTHLLDELTMPIEAVINLLYLIRASGTDVEVHDRFIAAAEGKMQEIVQIMKKYISPA